MGAIQASTHKSFIMIKTVLWDLHTECKGKQGNLCAACIMRLKVNCFKHTDNLAIPWLHAIWTNMLITFWFAGNILIWQTTDSCTVKKVFHPTNCDKNKNREHWISTHSVMVNGAKHDKSVTANQMQKTKTQECKK